MWLPKLSDNDQPRYLALVDAISVAIERGELSRAIACLRSAGWPALGLNPSTAMQAYREAARRHLVGGEVGRGTFVLASSREASLFLLSRRPIRRAWTCRPICRCWTRTIGICTAARRRWEHRQSLRCCRATLGLGATARARRGQPLVAASRAGAAAGADPALCRCTAGCVCRHAGPVRAGRTGVGRGVDLARHQGRCASAAPASAWCGARSARRRARGVRSPARATGARVAVLTPCLQNPTGVSMDRERREAIAELARRHDLLIIEDDVYGALGDEPPLATLLGERSVLVGSLSKTVAPGCVSVSSPRPVMAGAHRSGSAGHRLGAPPLCLRPASEWIEDGTALRRLARQRRQIERRWKMARKLLGPRVTGPASPHLWLTATDGEVGRPALPTPLPSSARRHRCLPSAPMRRMRFASA